MTDTESTPATTEQPAPPLIHLFMEDLAVTALLRLGRALKSTEIAAAADGVSLPRTALADTLKESRRLTHQERDWNLTVRASKQHLAREERDRQPLETTLSELLLAIGKPLPLPIIARELTFLRGAFAPNFRELAGGALKHARWAVQVSTDTFLHEAYLLDAHAPSEDFIISANNLVQDTNFQELSTLVLPESSGELADDALAILRLANRPLSLVRCPDGEGGECFYQKHVRPGTPEALDRVMVVEKSKQGEYVVVKDVAGLIALVQISVLEIHPWGSQADNLERPDRLTLDLDPDPSVKWPRVIEAAKELRDRFKDLGLQSFVKTTGGKGLHVVVPIERRTEWSELKEFARRFARAVERDSPSQYTTNMSKAARPNKIFLDYLRNERGSTAVAAYSTRARPSAAVSVPLDWKELKAGIKSDQFQIDEVKKRLARLRNDPWPGFFEIKQRITANAMKEL